MSRQVHASELKIQAELPERGEQERETSSFWFRRVTTAVLLGNGGGIIALASYLTNATDRAGVATLAFPALTSFFSGALLGFFSYTISLITASMRFDSHMNVFVRASEAARKAGKKTASTQHDGTFAFLIVLAGLQACCLVGAGASFYNGSSYILASIGREACRDSTELYCIGSPIIFPFVNPRPELQPEGRRHFSPVKPEDFSFSTRLDQEGWISDIFLSAPNSRTIRGITSSTTVQIVSPDGKLCLFATPFFADGGLALTRPTEISELMARMRDKGYSFTPVSSRIFIGSTDTIGERELTMIDIGFSGDRIFIKREHVDADISIVPYSYGDMRALAILHKESGETSFCLRLVEEAGFTISVGNRRGSSREGAR